MNLRPAAELLLLEAAAIEPILRAARETDFDLPTVCAGWSVRDVTAHCAAALTSTGAGDLHDFSPENNQADVDARRSHSVGQLIDELISGYAAAAAAIDAAGPVLDGIGLGEWIHGGDIRDALGIPGAYESEGVELALGLLVERSRRMDKPRVDVELRERRLHFGNGDVLGTITCDVATFVRICGGRAPDPDRYQIDGAVNVDELVLFS